MKKLTAMLLLSCGMFWSLAHAESFSPAIDCGGSEAIKIVIDLAAKHDYGMMAHNAASKYFETHPTQEFIDAKNYVVKAEAAFQAASQLAHDANARWYQAPPPPPGIRWGEKGGVRTKLRGTLLWPLAKPAKLHA